jgi:hypothetical protein
VAGRSERVYYFDAEGKENLTKTISLVTENAERSGISKVVMFTADGEGPRRAYVQLQRRGIRLIACTFAAGTPIKDPADGTWRANGIPDQRIRTVLQEAGVTIVRGGLPFEDSFIPGADDAKLKAIVETLNMFSGGLSLCVQAVVMATEAGAVEPQEEVIAMAADTAIVATGALKRTMFAPWGLVIRRFICKPEHLTITKKPGVSEEAGGSASLRPTP